VITRLWRGWTAKDNADAYEQFLLSELFPSMRSEQDGVAARRAGPEPTMRWRSRAWSVSRDWRPPSLRSPRSAGFSSWGALAEHL
jgi:hypothetical protein